MSKKRHKELRPNLWNKEKIHIVTSSKFYKIPKTLKNKVRRKSFNKLHDDLRDWLSKQIENHICHPTKAEKLFKELLEKQHILYEQQVFFRIEEKIYILDFYIPNRRLAVEIDGGVHSLQKDYDAKRDRDFKQIGIYTFRFKNNKVLSENVLNILKTWSS